MSEAGDTHLSTAHPEGGVSPSLLFVVNYPANTGYAWDNIERSFARVADRLADRGVRTFVAYPKIGDPPGTLAGSRAEAVELDATLASTDSLRATKDFVRRNGVRVVYLTDRPAWNRRYAALRRATGCAIVVHDRTSGARTAPRGLKRAAKRAVVRAPGVLADVVVAVSDFVLQRQLDVGLVPPDRVTRIYNGFTVEEGPGSAPSGRSEPTEARKSTHAEFGVDPSRPIIGCASRASREKGIDTLFRAFDRLTSEPEWNGPQPVLIYLGDGPHLEDLRALRSSLDTREDIVLGGYRPGAVSLLADADIFVVPSLWQDAFPSSVLEPMARGKPVVATSVGGIPEMIEPGVSGILVAPGDVESMSRAIGELLRDRPRAERMGREAQKRIHERFTHERQIDALVELLEARTGLLDPTSRDAASG